MESTIAKPPRKPLTPAQQGVLDCIRRITAENGLAPTMAEIAAELAVTKVTAFEHVGELERKGWLTREKHRSRSIRLTTGACPHCGREM